MPTNNQLTQVSSRGTGNSWCRAPLDRQIQLNNQTITLEEVARFLALIKCDARVVVPNRMTKQRWGVARISRNEVVLYRCSVWVFLHEVAHMLTPGCGHGPKFGEKLDALQMVWQVVEAAGMV